MGQNHILTFIAFVIGFAAGAICVFHDADVEKRQAIEKYQEDVQKAHDLVFQRMKNYEDLWLTCNVDYTACLSREISAEVKDSAQDVVLKKAMEKEKAEREAKLAELLKIKLNEKARTAGKAKPKD